MGRIVDGQGTRLLVRAVQLCHVQGLNQDRIGRQLGVSRSKVSRMLRPVSPGDMTSGCRGRCRSRTDDAARPIEGGGEDTIDEGN